jgi:hypothetical protein
MELNEVFGRVAENVESRTAAPVVLPVVDSHYSAQDAD